MKRSCCVVDAVREDVFTGGLRGMRFYLFI